MWALERWWVTERRVRGIATAGTKGMRGFLRHLGGSPWRRRKAEWRSRAAGPPTHHRKRKCCQRGQSEAECSLGCESCFWVSMMSARNYMRRPSCQETHLCKANPHHTHVSPLEAFKMSGYQLYLRQLFLCSNIYQWSNQICQDKDRVVARLIHVLISPRNTS